MKVSEIFTSIEGEGSRSGMPCVFVRLYGCNLKCSYCDSQYACTGDEYTEMTVDDIAKQVLSTGILNVTITGGEPLIESHRDDVCKLVCKLLGKGIDVNIETNGSCKFEDIKEDAEGYPGELIITMDWKSYSSGMSDHMIEENLYDLDGYDVLKFVVSNKQDLDQMKKIVTSYPLQCEIFVSPVFGEIDPKDIVTYLIDNKMSYVRMQLQMHKIIWNPDQRGV